MLALGSDPRKQGFQNKATGQPCTKWPIGTGRSKNLILKTLFPRDNARGQNNPQEGPESTRCPRCGSHLLGMALNDHKLHDCVFKNITPMETLEFMAVNHWTYCGGCNTRSHMHPRGECQRVGCYQCGSMGHATAQALCDLPIGGVTPEAQTMQQETAWGFRRECLQRTRALILNTTHPLKYRLFTDHRAIFIEAREPHDQAGWRVYRDTDNEFPFADIQRYSYTHENPPRRAYFTVLQPPEYALKTVNKIPAFSPDESAYLERCGHWITQYRQGNEVRTIKSWHLK